MPVSAARHRAIPSTASRRCCATKVLWANAAGYFAWIVREAATTPGIDPEAAFAGQVMVEATHLPDGSANPLHDPMQTVEGPAGPQRWPLANATVGY